MPETIQLLPKELRLPTFSRHYLIHQEQALAKGYGHIRYLSGLCEQEAADRYQKRVQKWTREAGLPLGKSFVTLALSEFSNNLQQQVIALKGITLGSSCRECFANRTIWGWKITYSRRSRLSIDRAKCTRKMVLSPSACSKPTASQAGSRFNDHHDETG